MKVRPGDACVKHIYALAVVLLFLSLLLPVLPPGRLPGLYLASQTFLAGTAVILAVLTVLKDRKGIRSLVGEPSVNVALWTASVVLVQGLFNNLPLVALIPFVIYPYTVFARRFRLFWVPAAILTFAALGRYLFFREPDLFYWVAAFTLYSALLGARMSRDGRYIEHLRSQLERIHSDAREMMGRIRESDFPEPSPRIRGEDAARAIALDEDDFLQRLLKWGCRVFSARTGILLVPDRLGYFRMRAAVHRGVQILEGLVPDDKGFIHITKERDGILCVSDASSAGKSLSFYPEGTSVGSFLVKIVKDPKWGKVTETASDGGKIRCILYFDSATINAMTLDDITARRLDEFGSLVLKAMDSAGNLQKLTTEMSSRDAISRYARGLTQSLDPEIIAGMALDAVVDAVRKCDDAVVMLYDQGFSLVASKGDLVKKIRSEKILKEEPSQIGLLLRRFGDLDSGEGFGDAQQAEIVINSPQAKRSPFFRKGEQLGDIVSFAAIPCYMGEGGSGLKAAIAVVSREPNAFGKEDLDELRTIVGMMAPALDNAVVHKQVDELSRTDGLTGLLNHRFFQIVLDGKLNNLERGYFKSLAVIMVDGDRFKNVNDTYGHQVGDEVLKEIARRLKRGVRKNDAVARYGGEEFAVVLDNAGESEAREIAEKMRRSIRSTPFKTSAGQVPVTASLGFSVLKGTAAIDKKTFLERADQALYQAKAGGRDMVVSFRDIENSSAIFEAAEAGGGGLTREV